MKNPFKQSGFDTIIGTETSINGNVNIGLKQTVIVQGTVTGKYISGGDDGEFASSGTLVVNGKVFIEGDITVHNVTVTGKLVCKTLTVEGTLAIKSGAMITADQVFYRDLVIEPGAIVLSRIDHLDYVSSGEQT
jgi:cytoskeletal protein CcmA (bactofilin family)